MSQYLPTQVAVYRHLLTRHAQDPSFRFSLRRSFSKKPDAVQGLFIGTETSGYFAFTLWHIPVGFPGSAMELISYVVKVQSDGSYRLKVEVLLPRNAPPPDAPGWHPNTLPGRGLVAELQQQSWPEIVQWHAAPETNKMFQLTWWASMHIPDLPALLPAFDAMLDATIPSMDAAIAAHAARTPGWIAHRYTAAQFDKMRDGVESRCADILAGKFPEPKPRPRSYWTTQVEAHPESWTQFQQQGLVRPLFNHPSAVSSDDNNEETKQLAQAQAGDVVVVTHGPRKVLGVGMVRGQFSQDAGQPTYSCPVEWLLTTSVELIGTPFNTGNAAWNRTKQWDAIKAAYAASTPELLNPLLVRFPGLFDAPQKIDERDGERDEPEEEVGYWWLNINPSYWKVDAFEMGQEQVWTTHNEKGNKRNVYKYFQQVQPGDLVVGYETSPAKRIKVILEITEGAHLNEDEREIISFRVREFVREELTREQLLQMPELQACEPLTGGQGSLYKLTGTEYQAIVDRARRIVAPALPSYSLADAEADLFLTTQQIEHLKVALRRKKNLIVQGPPGVGKTYVARRLAWLQMGEQDNSRVQLVQFHQSYSYEDFIRGWRPTEKGGFELANGVFVDFVRKAQHDQARDYFFIIDEINRGNLSKIFGELLMLLEADKRSEQYAMPLTYRKEGEAQFYLPPNLYLIGTMNTADRSLALVDYALRRRFTFVDLVPMLGEKLVQHLTTTGVPRALATEVVSRVEALNVIIKNDRNLGGGFLIGHSYFCTPPNGEGPEGWWSAIVEHDIAPLLREYWFDAEERAEKAIRELQGTAAE
ncbi:AAA family ATPase [Hymenobacter edaphi]|uniref:AAA+ ATPase domain-containing protein n=1 Tax=Hymenobacter edaphi TaxID=2211146 RepID=A0A328B6J4_9BACT|nr:AAA family ATPase [Hymenobacter edaphi]RAK62011.1 hypothetical protein DLM85_24565 [Hymenobacter edaphi]